ncbi:M20/M25/M40 family metallo-hydrolase [Aridibaculum aurantiacum]|uniref:M20/M25/M40 family metallo-hydrolase n=1 Tax=Aridibaculum aurantiacum TaxID=2810307 RepID=UPI001A973F0C|nr:M20/M25/M40 family metallo-hydrolase [Aridibaculum aurantiacum]
MNKLVALVIITLFYQSSASCQLALPYPSVDAQRAAYANKKWVKPTRLLDSLQIVTDLKFLASDTCEGRSPGSVGHELAMKRVIARMKAAGLDSLDNSLVQTFSARGPFGNTTGKNVIGWLKGKKEPNKFMVISAHYDHVGKNSRGTFYGADDNASGVACLLAMAKYFKKNPQPYSIIFAAFDREESGLQGAHKFVEYMDSTNRLSAIKFNLNMDMIARSDSNEMFASGTRHYPAYISVVEKVRPLTNTVLLIGHDYGSSREDWTKLSDQFAFHKKNIPFLFVSVEDHEDYHKPTDTVDRINLSRYIENCNMLLLLAKSISL